MVRNQGLPFSTIVLAIISVLVLVIIVLFFTGAFSRIGPSVTKTAPDTVTQAQAACQEYWSAAEQSTSTEMFLSSQYCTAAFNISGQLESCYDLGVGETITIDGVPCYGISADNGNTPPPYCNCGSS